MAQACAIERANINSTMLLTDRVNGLKHWPGLFKDIEEDMGNTNTPLIWKKRSAGEMKARIFQAIDENVNFQSNCVLGIPASYLDDKIFNQDATFLKDAPFISTLAKNPNHIGCHTLEKSEPFFKGTQAIEREVIEICAVDILEGEPQQQDGYIASGGTEANTQAIWIYRNYFQQTKRCNADKICILCSEDSHYSMDKAANLCALDIYKVPVDDASRALGEASVRSTIENAMKDGKRYFIVVCNMMTTVFGSVDDVSAYTDTLRSLGCEFKLHVDGAFGGFYYPFSESESPLTFKNPDITSFTLDAHKMAQAPYGTGIFLIRKNYIHYANTKQASYIEGEDYTLIGSRSGANAVAVWMILSNFGPYGWFEKIMVLQKRTEWMCQQLTRLNLPFYRHPKSNIIAMRATHLAGEVIEKYGLGPDDHSSPRWYKIVAMEHVTVDKLKMLVDDMDTLGPQEASAQQLEVTK